MARTRSKPRAAATKETTPEPPKSTAKPLPPSTNNPPKVFVLPKDTLPESRIVTLENPANGAPSRYYFCPSKGFYEFTCIAAPKKDCKSWLITPNNTSDGAAKDVEVDSEAGPESNTEVGLGGGHVTNKADLFLATPIDMLFLILPALAPKAASKQGDKQYFLSFEDHLEKLASLSRQWKVLLSQHPSLKDKVERRMAAVCDTATAGDETMYRLSTEKLTTVLTRKAERMCSQGLPPSMEERFVKTALEVPIMNVLRSDTFTATSTPADTIATTESQTTTTSTLSRTESDVSSTTTVESQTTAATSFTSTTEELNTQPALETPPETPHLLRLRTSLTYLSSSYLPPTLRHLVTSSPTPDFTALDTHLAALQKLRAEALALRSISDNITRKRGHDEDEGAVMEREEKKRKKEEEEKKKKSESRAVKQLKKVDTSGMRKLSSFFVKKAPAT